MSVARRRGIFVMEEYLGHSTKSGFWSFDPPFPRTLGLILGTWKQPRALQRGEESRGPLVLKLLFPALFSQLQEHLTEPEEIGNRPL